MKCIHTRADLRENFWGCLPKVKGCNIKVGCKVQHPPSSNKFAYAYITNVNCEDMHNRAELPGIAAITSYNIRGVHSPLLPVHAGLRI